MDYISQMLMAESPGGRGDRGGYVAVGLNDPPYLKIYKRDGDNLTELADPAILPTARVEGLDFSSDGTYLAVNTYVDGDSVYIYKRSGDSFTLLSSQPDVQITYGNGITFSPDDTYLVAVTHSGAPPGFVVYKRTGDNFVKLTNPSVLPLLAWGVDFSDDGVYLAVQCYFASGYTGEYVSVYKRDGDTFNFLDTFDEPLTSYYYGRISFSPGANYLAVVNYEDPFIYVYKRTGDIFNKLPDLEIDGDSSALYSYGTVFSPDGDYLVVGYITGDLELYSQVLQIYKRTGDTFTLLSQPDLQPGPLTPISGASLYIYGLDFSPNNKYLYVGYLLETAIDYEARLAMYERNGDNFIRVYDEQVDSQNDYIFAVASFDI